MVTALATVAELRAHMGIDDAVDDAHLTRVLDAASAWIESPAGCNRTFAVSASAARVYLPIRKDVLQVEDAVTVTAVGVDSAGNRTYSTALDSDDYDLLPFTGPPYQELRARTWAAWGFQPGTPVRVTGTWGFVEDGGVPVPVRQAALLLAARWLKRREAPFGILGATDLGTFERISKEDPDVAALLAPYRRGAAWIVV